MLTEDLFCGMPYIGRLETRLVEALPSHGRQQNCKHVYSNDWQLLELWEYVQSVLE
jgi:hypothetical protein